jgi:pSer/pThr/pTyr-binding forkhead associated (FHA) protein
MAVCPNGHDSASDDFCDVCGMRIGGSPATGPSPVASVPPPWPDVAAETCPRCGTLRTGQFCESCGFNYQGPRFVPAGSPSPAPPSSLPPVAAVPPTSVAPPVPSTPPAPSAESAPSARSAPSVSSGPASPSMSSFPYPQATWTAVVGADRAYYEQVQALTGPEGAAVTFPSYCAERRFQLVGNQMRIGRRSVSRGLAPEIDLTGPPADPGISRLHAVLVAAPDGSWAVLDPGSANGTLINGSEIGIGDQVPLHDGDRINLGAWTAITVHRGLGNSLPGVGHRPITTDHPRH